MRMVTTMAANTVAASSARNTQMRPLRARRNWWKVMTLSSVRWVGLAVDLEQALFDVDHVVGLDGRVEVGIDPLHARGVAAADLDAALGAAGSDPAAHGDRLHHG